MWLLQYHAGAQYLVAEWTSTKVVAHRVFVAAPQLDPASHFKSTKCGVSFWQIDTKCLYNISSFTPRYVGLAHVGMVQPLTITFNSWFPSTLLKWKQADSVLVVVSLASTFLMYFDKVAVIWDRALSFNTFQSCVEPIIIRLSGYANFFCSGGRKVIWVRVNSCRTPFIRHLNLLLRWVPVVRVKLQLYISSIIRFSICLSGTNRNSLQERQWCHTVSYAAVKSTNTTPAFFRPRSYPQFFKWEG